MNIFILDHNPQKCAEYHCDKHCVKMILESAQLLSTAHHILDPEKFHDNLYKKTHINHPCSKWVRESFYNYQWLFQLFSSLCKEYTLRYNKIHLCEKKLLLPLYSIPKNIPLKEITPFAQAMPDKYKHFNAIEAYRNYYINEKQSFCKWSKRSIPEWFTK